MYCVLRRTDCFLSELSVVQPLFEAAGTGETVAALIVEFPNKLGLAAFTQGGVLELVLGRPKVLADDWLNIPLDKGAGAVI